MVELRKSASLFVLLDFQLFKIRCLVKENGDCVKEESYKIYNMLICI